jgi:LPS-assembly protein
MGSWRQTIEPLASVTVSPYGGNPTGIPNEDSTAVAFNTSSLLQSNRYAGLDRVESGPRAMAGMRMGVYASGGGSGSFMFGEVFRMKPDDGFSDQTGLSGTRSDYVGRVDLLPTNYLDITQRFRLGVDDLSLKENEIIASLGPSRVKFNIGYLKAKGDLTDASLPDREEIYSTTAVSLDDYWSVSGTIRRNLLAGGNTISQGAALSYRDECLIASVLFNERFTRDRDIAPSTSINFVIQLLNLG